MSGERAMKNTCFEFSLELGEPLAGTAPNYEGFLLIECPLPWSKKEMNHSLIPEGLEEKTRELGLRPLLISGENTHPGGPYSVYIYHRATPVGAEYKIGQLQELFYLLSPSVSDFATRTSTSRQVVLVCTHGTRDQCCGKQGYHFYKAFLEAVKKRGLKWDVWRVSHLGGHRFSANVAVFPEGRFYGRLEVDEIENFIDLLEQKKVYHQKCRGLSSLPEDEQVAELWGWERVDTEREKASVKVEKDGDWHKVNLLYGEEEGPKYKLKVEKASEPLEIYGSCGDEEKKQVWTWKVTHFEEAWQHGRK